jgi:hypothetical protein
MSFLKKLFNWFKLFVAIDFMAVSVFMPISAYLDSDENEWEERLAAIIVGFIFFVIGLLLLWWYNITRKKLQPERPTGLIESRFYYHYPTFSSLLDGWNFNGSGTKYLTYTHEKEDGSFCATKWITVAFFPIVPLYQERIRILTSSEKMIPFIFSLHKERYTIIKRIKLSKKLITNTYLFYYLFFLPAIVVPVILMIAFVEELNTLFSGPRFWFVLLAYLAWGICLMYITECWNKRFFLRRKTSYD